MRGDLVEKRHYDLDPGSWSEAVSEFAELNDLYKMVTIHGEDRRFELRTTNPDSRHQSDVGEEYQNRTPGELIAVLAAERKTHDEKGRPYRTEKITEVTLDTFAVHAQMAPNDIYRIGEEYQAKISMQDLA